MSQPKPLPMKFCAWCEKPLVRKMYGKYLEDRGRFLARKFCDLKCSGAAHTSEEPTLAALRKRHQALLTRADACAECGTTEQLGIHHLDENPANNELENVITLCASCHTRWHWQHGKAPARISPPCSVCGEKSRRNSMCQKHWGRFKKYGDPLLTKKSGGPGLFSLVRVSPQD